MEKDKTSPILTDLLQDVNTYPQGLSSKYAALPFSEEDWQATPVAVRTLVIYLYAQVEELKPRIEELETSLRKNSSNSSKPPSTDSPYQKKAIQTKPPGKPGGKKGHPGHRQEMLEPTKTYERKPELCTCGNTEFGETHPYHTHQVIEFPEIPMDVTHYILHEGPCQYCGKLIKASLPPGVESGYGPRLSALIGEIAGNQGSSRTTVQDFCSSVLGITISIGAIQKVIDRVSEAIKPHYEAIGKMARTAKINYIDETAWFKNGALMWMWAMVNSTVAYFMIHPHRSKEAFTALIEDWVGILVSDGYGVYQKWVELRQTCLGHLIRKARALSEKANPEIAAFGIKAMAELQRLCHMSKAPPTVGEWRAFYARFSHLISKNHDRQDEAGKFARRLLREMDSLWVFLEVQGVEPTNNRAERSLRFGVLWRKRSQGTCSEKGNRWAERIISLRQTCRLRSKPTFPILVEAIESYFHEQPPDLSWISQP